MRTLTLTIAALAIFALGLAVRKDALPTPEAGPSPSANASEAVVTPTPVTSEPASPTATSSSTPTPVATGTLKGTISIGPNCPVEQAGHPCTPSAEQYQAHPLRVYQGSTLIKSIVPDANGHYQISLAPGTYRTEITKNTAESSNNDTTTVTIQAGQTVTLNVSIDTGIR